MTIAVTVVTAIKQWHTFNITKTSHCSALITGPITNHNYEALELQRRAGVYCCDGMHLLC